jgi:N-acetylneuraminic acid mutarotase
MRMPKLTKWTCYCFIFLTSIFLAACGGGSSTSPTTNSNSNTTATWTSTGSIITGRADYTSTLLPNGKVLVTGGIGATNVLASSELYDPATATWSATGSLTTARYGQTATLLSSGKVLVTGGATALMGSPLNPTNTVELYDPATGSWTVKSNMTIGRDGQAATLLTNGKVLVSGGSGSSGYLASAELYDPSADTWTSTGSMANPHGWHSATQLTNGKVLVAGGAGGSTNAAELFDPVAGTWTATGNLTVGRSVHTSTLLQNGKVLVAGGWAPNSSSWYTASAELYDPAVGTWSATGSLITSRAGFTPIVLANGKVLVAGGISGSQGGNMIASAELYDPSTGVWSATGGLSTARTNHTTTMLNNGKVLVTGGGPVGNGSAGTPHTGAVITSSELY